MGPIFIQWTIGASVVGNTILFLLILKNWGQPRMKMMVWMAALITMNSIGYLLEVRAGYVGNLREALRSFRFQRIAGPFLGVTAFFLALDYAEISVKSFLVRAALLIVPVTAALPMILSERIPAFYARNFALAPLPGGSTALSFNGGPLYYVSAVYNFLFFLAYTVLIVYHFARTGRSALHKVSFAVFSLLPLVSRALWWAGIFRYFDPLVTSSSFALAAVYIYIMRYRELEWRSLGWEAIADRLGDAVMVVNDRRKIIMVNAAFEKFFPGLGYRDRPADLRDFTRFIGKRLREAYPETLVGDLLKPEESDWTEGEFSLGPESIFAVKRRTISEDGRSLGHILVLNNVSAYRNMIDRIVELKQKAEAASRSKSEFLSAMSHEIRTPLNAIIGFSEILLWQNLETEVLGALEKIHDSGSLLLGIVSDILDISKIESGSPELNPTAYNFPRMLSDTINLNLIRIGTRPLVFSLEVDETIPQGLLGDELRVKQILNNVLSNAIKYTERGSVVLDVRWEAEAADVAALTFRVIRAEDMGKLFNRYSQFNLERNRRIEGTGLGLSIAGDIAALMGGTITAESEYGKGSVFTVRIRQEIVDRTPLGAEAAVKLKSFRYTGAGKGRRDFASGDFGEGPLRYRDVRILVTDDMASNIQVARGLMSPWGVTVDGALSGGEALELIRAGNPRYDLIFMDHMMPEMDGIQCTQGIRSLEGEYARSIPIVALTANALAGNRELFLSRGMNDSLAKPINMEKLFGVLRKWLPPEKRVSPPPAGAGGGPS
ncbi:MAG: response regulator [Spirochaetaceae bacterium]|jgi:signal transduction histidine kinase/ActR/RegA family two-component response regulator|nr:response regulator [Spirochaetaceae bacterium]